MKNIRNDSLPPFKVFETVTVPRRKANYIYHYELADGKRTGRGYLYELALNDGYKLWKAFADDCRQPYYIIAQDKKGAKKQFEAALQIKMKSVELCSQEEADEILLEFWRTPYIVLGR